MRDCRSWVRIKRVYGGKQVKQAYESLARDGLGPETGYIWSMWDEDQDIADKRTAAQAKL
jgi:hypothetical protein